MDLITETSRWRGTSGRAALTSSIAGASEIPASLRDRRRAHCSVFYDEDHGGGGASSPEPGTYQSGLFGEEVVADGLRRAGWEVLGHRLRTRVGEIDLIARRGSMIVFAEVKTAGPRRLDVASAVSAQSRSRIRRAAVAWMQSNQRAQRGVRHYRFDVFLVHRDDAGGIVRIDHVRDAF